MTASRAKADIVWTEPALSDLDEIADHIALESPRAAKELVQRVFARVEHLASHPRAGVVPSELPRSRYRQVVEPPCRVFYRVDGRRVLILHVMRGERLLAPGKLDARTKRAR